MGESVRAGNRGEARMIRLPGTELASTFDFTSREWIAQGGVVRHRLPESGIIEREMVNMEHAWQLTGFCR